MNIILFDEPQARKNLLPLTFTRPVADIRVGISTLAKKWSRAFGTEVSYLTEPYLGKKYQTKIEDDNLLINGSVCPTPEILKIIEGLQPGHGITQADIPIAIRTSKFDTATAFELFSDVELTEITEKVTIIDEVWKIFKINGEQIREDYKAITAGRKSCIIEDTHTIIYGANNIFVEEGVEIKAAVLNADNGPIYLGKNAKVHEGAIIKGPFSLGEGAEVNMASRMRGDITIGPYCKVGGEISNSVIFGFSNKGHDGFLGNSVIGEWCNLGAGTNTSNLKNNYADVKIWNYEKGGFRNTGEQFCGLIMGDHTKTGINSMLNTGTVTGVSANIFGAGFPRNFVPSFSWGGSSGFTTFQIKKAFEVAEIVMARRGKNLDDVEKEILTSVFEQTAEYRIWENSK